MGDPDEPFEEVVRVTRIAPQPDVADPALVCGVALERCELRVRDRLAEKPDDEERGARDLERVKLRRAIEAGEKQRKSKECIEYGLEFKEAQEFQIEVAARTPFLAQLRIAAFFGLTDDALREV